ncbi:unnamed protein product [Kuraishia capsulata CBS 1993]|uniref:Major facilitator superfamily (MFS) profile domain-containing protein n=1 Tax=Kuraishia capsulata CBS 1993 TaxID=1382522 RepID=W6MNK7_9ASCO|nr:uncharacterized protein KUCA_T00004193001 [Kuraishia capsulata CBS 1993]CDK28211.1 unnamed protein product [Kuraishia capsulata CBS 1993]
MSDEQKEVNVEVDVKDLEQALSNVLSGHIPEDDGMKEIMLRSYRANEQEKQIGVREACRRYPRAVFWTIIFSLGVIMCGYDAQIISSFYALPAFQKKYGDYVGDDTWAVSAAWQSGLSMGSPIGQVVGTLAAGPPIEWWGRKKCFAAVNVLCIGFVFMQFFAPNIKVLCAGEILSGMLWGVCVLIGPTYASEVAPTSLRGILTAGTNLAFVIGQLIASGITKGLSTNNSQWAYRIPFGVQWVWPVIILAVIFWAPESPYWLVRQNDMEGAKAALRKLAWSVDEEEIERNLSLIKETDALEREMENKTSYWDCFTGIDRFRSEICIMVYSIQVIGGNPLIGYATNFFEVAGLPTDKAFDMSLGMTAMGFVGTVLCWPLLEKVGRRPMYLFGIGCMTILLFIIAFLDCAKNYSAKPGLAWAQASIMVVWTFLYQATSGPLTFVLIGEIPSTKLRGKTIAIATAIQSLCSIVTTVALPYMFSAEEANMRGKVGFVFGGICIFCSIWAYFRLPETRNRTFEDLDIMFYRKVPPRHFKKYVIVDSKTLDGEAESA